MIGDPTKLVIRAKFPRLSADALAPFRERSTSFVVDAMNGRGLCLTRSSRSTRAAGSSAARSRRAPARATTWRRLPPST